MSNSNETSSSDSATPSSGRFSRGLITRIVAVALFLAVGTFAVTQSLKSKSQDDVAKKDNTQTPDDQPQDNSDDATKKDETESSPTVDISAFGTGFQNKENPKDPKSVSPTATNPNGSAGKSPTGLKVDNPRFKLSDTNSLVAPQNKKADSVPAVVRQPNPKKNLVAKPVVGTQDVSTSGGRFSAQPGAFQIPGAPENSAAKATETGPKPPGLAQNPAQRPDRNSSNPKGDFSSRLPSNLNLNQEAARKPNNPPRNTLAQPRTRQFPADSGAFTTPPRTPAQENAKSAAGIDPMRSLTPVTGPGGLRDQTRNALSGLDRPTASPSAVDRPVTNTNPNPTGQRNAGGTLGGNRPFGAGSRLSDGPNPTAAARQETVGNRNLPANTGLPSRNGLAAPNQNSGLARPNRQLGNNLNPTARPRVQDPGTQQNSAFNQRPPTGSLNPNAGRNFRNNTTPPTSQANLGNRQQVQPTQVPVRQASTSRPIAPATSGVRTMPTPGDKNLEGARTPSLTVQRVAPREIQLNTPATFEVVVRNVGKVEANDVRVYDQIPTGTQLLEATPQPNENTRGSVQWTLGTIAPGQERRIKMKLRPTQPGEIGSVAHVTFATQSSVRTLVTKPVLEITHSAPPKSLIGDRVPLDIVVTNKGNGPAHQVIIQEDIPNQLEYSDGFRQIEYEVGTLAPGQSRKLQLVLKAASIGKLRNTIHANANGGLKSQHSVNMEIVAPKLTASSDGPRRRYLRRKATHEFNVRNGGTAAATNVELMAKLPPGLKFVEANNRGQFDPATNAVYWSLAELDAGVAAKVSLTTVPIATGNQGIDFSAVADLKQKATAQAGLMVEHLVDVFFDIDDVIDHIEVGSETQYQVRVVNQGTKTATNVRLQLDFSNGIRPKNVEGSLQSQIQGQRVTFAPITSMNPGDEIKVTVVATGTNPGEHKVIASMMTDGRQSQIAKEETTQVYSDR